jgi:hypothetical protein
MTDLKMGFSVVSWRLPTVLRNLSVNTEPIVRDAAEYTRGLWAADVRVSPGSGHYNGTHYRDNIFVTKIGKNSFYIYTPVPYAIHNELGGPLISPRPSAAVAYREGQAYFERALRQAWAEAILG